MVNGTRPPPIERLEDWAAALGLTGDERERFLTEAKLAHCPPDIAASFWSRADIARLDQIAGADLMRRRGEDAVALLRGLSVADLARLPEGLRAAIQTALAGDEVGLQRVAPSLAFRAGGLLFDPRSALLGERIRAAVATTAIAADPNLPAAPTALERADAEVARLRAELAAAHTREQALTTEVTQLKDDLVALGRQLADQRRQAESLLDRLETIAAGRAHRDDVPRMNRMVPQTSTSDVAARAEAEAALLRQALAKEPAPEPRPLATPVAPAVSGLRS